MKNYTSIEQSKKLLELGIDPLTSDMCYKTEDVDYAETEDDCVLDLICRPYSEYLKFVGPMGLAYKAIPCWSLGALISLLPKRYCLETLDDGTYACYNFLSKYEKFGKTPTDAVYSMIVFLKEEKLI